MSLLPKLHEDIRQIVLKRLPHDPEFVLELAVKTPAELLIIFSNWQSHARWRLDDQWCLSADDDGSPAVLSKT
jgi:hypothetical protein